MTARQRPRAIIIGGSIAGLFAGHFLRRAGWHVDVYERSVGALSARGAGIMTVPELHDALALLGLDPEHGFGVRVEERVTIDAHDQVIASLMYPQMATSWTRVYDLLAGSFPSAHMHFGTDLIGIEDGPNAVTAHFGDGRRISADVLIGADGVRSTVRRHLYPGLEPSYAGYVAWRGFLPEADLQDPGFQRAAKYTFCFPPGEQMIGYPIAGPGFDLRAGHRSYNFVWYRPADAERELPALLTDSHGQRHQLAIPPQGINSAVIAEMRAHGAQVMPPWFRKVLALTPRPFLQPVYDLAVPEMARGRIALIGDAAFVIRPHVGAGVFKAADDARVLADNLGDRSINSIASLKMFSESRMVVGQRMLAQAQRLGSYLKYTYTSEAERRAAAVIGTPDNVMAETGNIDFMKSRTTRAN
jgi:2-polyprenyl-6-methoxyphenol hydroxylase-like FAD-dependent oxidoreductase